MQKYEFLEHTADVTFKAYGSALNELFENAAALSKAQWFFSMKWD
ncbi:MAG: archease [Halobacteriota archaeon]